jgi:hypothetical protein
MAEWRRVGTLKLTLKKEFLSLRLATSAGGAGRFSNTPTQTFRVAFTHAEVASHGPRGQKENEHREGVENGVLGG